MNRLSQSLDILDRAVSTASRVLLVPAGCALVGMMLVSVANIVLRAFSMPLSGTVEVVGWLAAVAAALALPATHRAGSHASVDYVVDRLPQRYRAVTAAVVNLLGSVVFALAARQLVLQARRLQQRGGLSETLRIPFYPLLYLVATGLALLTLLLVLDTIRSSVNALRP